jgi:type IV secretion system protein VirB10
MNIETNFGGSTPAERDIRPVVALPRGGVPGLVIVLVAAVLAVMLFLVLDSQRKRAAFSREKSEAGDAEVFAAPPTLDIPPVASPEPQIITIPAPQLASPTPMAVAPPAASTSAVAAPVVPAPAPAPQFYPPPPMSMPPLIAPPSEVAGGSLSEPAVVIDSGAVVTSGLEGPAGLSNSMSSAGADGGTKSDTTPTGTRLTNRTTLMPTGTLIPAVLETPIDTSRPGLVRAIVSRDARGFDGRRVLVPRGSRLIGECQGEVKSGQSRVLVNWTRLILPDGLSIKIDSPAADSLGGSGVPGHLNSFFLERFFSSALQSALNVGESLLGRRTGTTVVVGLPNGSVTNVATQNVSSGPQPKITVQSGALINVFVAHDLDFSKTSPGR